MLPFNSTYTKAFTDCAILLVLPFGEKPQHRDLPYLIHERDTENLSTDKHAGKQSQESMVLMDPECKLYQISADPSTAAC